MPTLIQMSDAKYTKNEYASLHIANPKWKTEN